MVRAKTQPIYPGDVENVGEFLHLHLNHSLSPAEWAASIRAPWRAEAPNHGFMLVEADAIVGVYLAFYSTRRMAEREERFCNLAAWCVLPQYRLYSLLLLRALLAQKGCHFTDLSPSGNTVPVNERLKFQHLDTTTALVPNLPWPSRARIVSDAGALEAMLRPQELEIFRDHEHARAAYHLVLVEGNAHCYVIYRRDRRKRLPLFASILYVSNPPLFRKLARRFGSHLLFHHGVLATLAELRVVGGQPAGSILLRKARPKMYKSDTLQPGEVDYLYSELTCVAW